MLKDLRQKINTHKELKRSYRYYINLPLEESHTGHTTDATSVLGQTVHPLIIDRIHELVNQGRYWVIKLTVIILLFHKICFYHFPLMIG